MYKIVMFLIYINPDLALVNFRETGLSLKLIECSFDFRQVYVGFVVDKVTLEQTIIITPPLLLTHILIIYHPATEC